MRELPVAVARLAALTVATPATAQNHLGIHLDTMLEGNLRQHQQQHANDGPAAKQRPRWPKPGTMSPTANRRSYPAERSVRTT